jgi:hypothetical protein
LGNGNRFKPGRNRMHAMAVRSCGGEVIL